MRHIVWWTPLVVGAVTLSVGCGGSDPRVEPSVAATSGRLVTPSGFDRVRATATAPDGTVCDLCLWVADTPELRSRGLMGVTDLGDADGMAFRYSAPHSGSFWMKDTLLDLSIAFFDADGGFLQSFDMEPCRADPCRRYPTPRGFVVAVETALGDLGELSLVAGSELVLTDRPCDGGTLR